MRGQNKPFGAFFIAKDFRTQGIGIERDRAIEKGQGFADQGMGFSFRTTARAYGEGRSLGKRLSNLAQAFEGKSAIRGLVQWNPHRFRPLGRKGSMQGLRNTHGEKTYSGLEGGLCGHHGRSTKFPGTGKQKEMPLDALVAISGT